MDLTKLEDLRTAMRLAGIRPNKSLGQHFLVDQDSLSEIIAAAYPSADDTVLEVGPGLGVMTRPLTEIAETVYAVETDRVLAELLRRDAPKNLTIVEEDILKFNLQDLPADYKVVANIPYYLTSKLIRSLLESSNPPAVMSLLIQKEVAERIVAEPGKMSILAISVQYYGLVEIAGIVDRHKFWPAPAVDSAILRVVRRPKPAFPADISSLFRLVKAGFGEKRKQLKNSLAGGLNMSPELTSKILSQAQILPTARAQELSLADWERLYMAVEHEGIF